MNKIPWPRKIGELLVRLEGDEGEENIKTLLQETRRVLAEVVDELPEEFRQTAKLAVLIQRLRRVNTTEEVERILTEGMKIHKVRTLSSSEAKELKEDKTKRALLVFIHDEVWGPVDWNNKGHQALIINARQALGRLKRKQKAEEAKEA